MDRSLKDCNGVQVITKKLNVKILKLFIRERSSKNDISITNYSEKDLEVIRFRFIWETCYKNIIFDWNF